MDPLSRRALLQRSLDLLVVSSLVELSNIGVALAEVSPAQRTWWRELGRLCEQVRSAGMGPTDWQRDVEALCRAAALPSLMESVDFTRLREAFERGPQRDGLSVQSIGLPRDVSGGEGVYRRRLFALAPGRAVVPHGHNNLTSAFLVLRGRCHGRHFDRSSDGVEGAVLRPTIDRVFTAGDASTISDERDNVHWFRALGEPTFMLNISVRAAGTGRFGRLATGRVYLDPTGPVRGDGTLLAPHLTREIARSRFG